jgi:hypothetical protein
MKHAIPQARRSSTRAKALVTGGLVALTAAGIGGAAFATFTGTTSAQQAVDSGTVSLAGIGSDTLSIGASDIAAGDTLQRAVTIENTGTIDLSGVSLTTSAAVTSGLDQDTTDGLHMTIDRCSGTWVESTNPYTYTCSGGTVTTIVTNTSIIGGPFNLAGLDLTTGASETLRVTLDLPSSAPNSLQNQSSTIDYTFTGTQRAGTGQ